MPSNKRFSFLSPGVFTTVLGILFVAGVALSFHLWTNRAVDAERALAQKGFSQVSVGTWYPWCYKGEVGSRFSATSSDNKRVAGHVCVTYAYSRVSAS